MWERSVPDAKAQVIHVSEEYGPSVTVRMPFHLGLHRGLSLSNGDAEVRGAFELNFWPKTGQVSVGLPDSLGRQQAPPLYQSWYISEVTDGRGLWKDMNKLRAIFNDAVQLWLFGTR